MDITDYPQLYFPKPRQIAIPSGPTHQTVVYPLLNQLSTSEQNANIEFLSAYPTRYYTSDTGVQAANWLVEKYTEYAGNRADIEVEQFDHDWPQPTVVARMIGTRNPEEIVIIGGHIDSTSNGAIAPGADDNASGSSTVLEIFRVLAGSNFQPERTIEFHGYAAEEVGLRGSQDIANAYGSGNANVVGMLNLDMTGYARPGFTRTIGITTDFTHAGLSSFLRTIVSEYALQINWSNTACGYACSDHASWTRAGFPAARSAESLFANRNPNIHTVNDVQSNLNSQHTMEFLRVGTGFVVELSYVSQ